MNKFRKRMMFLALLIVLASNAAPSFAADPGAIEKSKLENGLSIYGNVADENWDPLIKGFNKKYPWINVTPLDIGPSVCFERYYAETSVNQQSADMIVSGSPTSWMRFAQKDGAENYKVAGNDGLPKWSHPFPGIYTFSTDPMIMIYNKIILTPDKRPSSLAELAELCRKYPAVFKGKLTTYDAARHSFAYAIGWSYAHHGMDGWKMLKELAPDTNPEGASAQMMDKLTSGEYVAAYFGSGLSFFQQMIEDNGSEVLGWNLISDGTPVMMRGIAITRTARSKYSAQLLMDYVVSHEGQVCMAQGGMTPYRSDVKKEEVPYLTYDLIRQKLGDQNVILVGYDPQMLKDNDSFVAQWQEVFKESRKN